MDGQHTAAELRRLAREMPPLRRANQSAVRTGGTIDGVVVPRIWLKYPLSWLAPVYWVAVGGLIVGTFIDLEHYIIPDEITIGGVVAGFVASILVPSLHGETFLFLSGFKSLLGILIGSGLVLWIAIFGELIFRKEAMGFGDVKLTAAIGAFFGWQGAVFALAVSSVIGSIVGFTVGFAVAGTARRNARDVGQRNLLQP